VGRWASVGLHDRKIGLGGRLGCLWLAGPGTRLCVEKGRWAGRSVRGKKIEQKRKKGWAGGRIWPMADI
jgi:hypothetical protein